MAEVENEVSEFLDSMILMKNRNIFSSPVPFPQSLNGKRILLEIICFLMCFFASTVCPSGLTKKTHFHVQSRVRRFPLSSLQFTLSAFVFPGFRTSHSSHCGKLYQIYQFIW